MNTDFSLQKTLPLGGILLNNLRTFDDNTIVVFSEIEVDTEL